jgi:hypothetical protein
MNLAQIGPERRKISVKGRCDVYQKTMSCFHSSLVPLAVLISIVLLMPAASVAQKIKIQTEDGVTVVRNPKKPVPQPGGPSKLLLKEDLVLGKEAGESGYLFAGLRSLGVDDQENIWTLDWQDIKIRIFDKNGKPIGTFGKKGQGPQELQSPSRMVVTGDGIGAILDLNKIAFYAVDGRCLKEISTARTNPFRLKIDGKGFIYLDSMDMRKTKVLTLTKFDPELKPIAMVASYEEPFVLGVSNPFTTILYFHPTKDGRLIWLVTKKYEFHVLDSGGKPIRKIVKDYAPLKISADEQKRILKERYADMPYKLKIEFPEAYPPVEYFIGDDEDRLYARTHEEDGRGGLWYDVFDPEGRSFTRFALPKEEMAFIIKKNKLYALISENEEGIPLVKRYAMEWK